MCGKDGGVDGEGEGVWCVGRMEGWMGRGVEGEGQGREKEEVEHGGWGGRVGNYKGGRR